MAYPTPYLLHQMTRLRITLSALLLLMSSACFSQYVSECFFQKKEQVKNELISMPVDSAMFPDSILVNGEKKSQPKKIFFVRADKDPIIQKMEGCRMPDFSFYTLNKEDLSIDRIKSDFTIVCFSSTSYGDVCNARLHNFCKLKNLLKDSLTVITIFQEKDETVSNYARDYDSNIEFVANADRLTNTYTIDRGHIIYILDKYKNIIYVKSQQHYHYTPDEIFYELLNKIRGAVCED
jgi:hypothetical protein